jgi:hypothetical protein
MLSSLCKIIVRIGQRLAGYVGFAETTLAKALPARMKSGVLSFDENSFSSLKRLVLRSSPRTRMRPLLASLVLVACWRCAGAQDAQQSTQPQFEVVAIKPSADAGSRLGIGVAPGGRMTVKGVPVRFMIRFAYSVQDFQISGGPPDERHEYRNGDATTPYPLDRWKYRLIEGIGNDVTIEFVDPTRSGGYHMTMDPNRPPEIDRRQPR